MLLNLSDNPQQKAMNPSNGRQAATSAAVLKHSHFLSMQSSLIRILAEMPANGFERFTVAGMQGNEVYGGSEFSAGIFLHRSTDYAVVKGTQQEA